MTETVLGPPVFSLDGFKPNTRQSILDAFVDALRPYLARVIAVTNGKGGQGKTSITTHVAARLAEIEAEDAKDGTPPGRVLVIEVDQQGNTRFDLGVIGGPLDDKGASLAKAIIDGGLPTVIRDVRPGLDLIAGGSEMKKVTLAMPGLISEHGGAAYLSLAVMVAKMAHEYAWIIIDFPPSEQIAQMMGLAAAGCVLIPLSASDSASVAGLAGINELFEEVDYLNPYLKLLGIALFGFTHQYYKDPKSGEKRAVGDWVNTRKDITTLIDDAGLKVPVFESVIRYSRVVGKAIRARGQLAGELAQATDGISRSAASRGKEGDVIPQALAAEIHGDYVDLTDEIWERYAQMMEEDQAEEEA